MWDNTLEKPGCAFSRSIGDNVAKKVGVCAEPEILHWDLGPGDRFAVIASDGVFEFITSQNVVDMLAKFADPIEGAKHVVAEAYRLWLTYDDRTDDITMIVVYFEDLRARSDTSGASVSKTPREGGGESTLLFCSVCVRVWYGVCACCFKSFLNAPVSFFTGRMQRALSISKGTI